MGMNKELLIHCILLLLHDKTAANQSLVRDLLAIYDEDVRKEGLKDDDVISFFIRAIRTILARGIDRHDQVALSALLIEFKSDSALAKEYDLYELLSSSLLNSTGDASSVDYSKKKVQTAVLQSQVMRSMRQMFSAVMGSNDISHPDDQRKVLDQVMHQAESMKGHFQKATPTSGPPGMLDRISFSNPDSIRAGLVKHRRRNIEGVMKLGLQGMNKMFGPAGGVVRGESIVFNAMSHNYKSGMLQSVAMWIPKYNPNPVCNDPKKTPLILMVTLENEAYQNMYWIFKQLYIAENGHVPEGMSEDQVTLWVSTYFKDRGYQLEIVRYLPSTFGYDEMVALVEYFEGMGYEIHCLIIDYMNKMKKGSSERGNVGNHLLVAELYSKSCNYTKSKMITLVTAHQLNRDASKLKNQTTNIVKQLNESHLGDSIDVQREVDCAIYMHIEHNRDGVPFLTMRKDKHRYVDGMAEKDKWCAYPFSILGIMDDMGKEPGYVRDIYLYTAGENGEGAEAASADELVF